MTTQKKTIAKGTTLKLNGTVYARVENLNPPGQVRPVVEGEELNPVNDAGTVVAYEIPFLGDEELSTVEFTHYWQPGDADAEQLKTWLAAETTIPAVITYPARTGATGATGSTDTFDVKVSGLAPEQMTKRGWIKRKVTLLRCSAIVTVLGT